MSYFYRASRLALLFGNTKNNESVGHEYVAGYN